MFKFRRPRRPSRWAVAASVLFMLVITSGLGADQSWWPAVPDYLGRLATSGCAAMGVVAGLHRWAAPILQSYRLGLSHGRAEQRRRCADACGHECDDAGTGLLPKVVGDESYGGQNGATVTQLRLVRDRAKH